MSWSKKFVLKTQVPDGLWFSGKFEAAICIQFFVFCFFFLKKGNSTFDLFKWDFEGVRTGSKNSATKALQTRGGGGGGMLVCSPRKIFNLGSRKCHFLRFLLNIFRKQIRRKCSSQLFNLPISSVIDKLLCSRGKNR